LPQPEGTLFARTTLEAPETSKEPFDFVFSRQATPIELMVAEHLVDFSLEWGLDQAELPDQETAYHKAANPA
jgi:hypothetical protein